MNAGEIEYRITGDNSGLNRSLDNVNNAANTAAQSITQAAEATNAITENAGQASSSLEATAAAAANISDSAAAAAAATGNAAQSADVSRAAYEAALNTQRRLAEQIAATTERLNSLRAVENDMSAAQQRGDISAAAYSRYQRQVQETTSQLNALNIQQNAVNARVQDMSRSLGSAASASNNASNALRDTGSQADQAANNVNDIARAADQVDQNTNAAANNGALQKIGEGAKKAAGWVLKISAAAVTAAAGTVAALAKSAVDSYAEYEQLIGGVETLFGNSADVIKGYADNAYKTAGMSANAYMETVTGFSASLLQGLDGDTAKAAEIANQAVTDMSDNANKMGTDMSLIQNAYQGFAKQNYTMLDNLKLGYGGTQAEMARLINDSGVLGDSMEVTAETVNNVSFDKIIEAINVIQTDMGITGTTAKEAATTIQGSIASLSAAWTNFLTGAADPTQDFDALLHNVVDSFLTVTDNLMPRIQAVLPQLAEGLTGLVNGILPEIPEMINRTLPEVLKGADAIIRGLLDALTRGIETAGPIISENAPVIIETLVDGIRNALPQLATAGIEIIGELIKSVLDNAGDITQGALDIITALADGLTEALPELIPAAVEAILIITETLFHNVDKLLEAGFQLITGLAEGLLNSLPELIKHVPAIIVSLTEALILAIPEVTKFAFELCSSIGEYIANFDWSDYAEKGGKNLKNALSWALTGEGIDEHLKRRQEEDAKRIAQYKNLTVDQIDNTKNYLMKKLGELNEISVAADANGFYDWDALPEWVRRGVEGSGLSIGEYVENYKNELLQQISDLDAARKTALDINKTGGDEWLAEEEERRKRAQEVFDKYGINMNADGSQKNSDTSSDDAETLDSELADLENKFATHKVTEEQYWAKRKEILEKYRDDNDPEWWKLYDKVTDHYDTLAETEKEAAEKAAKESEQAAEKAARDRESNLKNTVENTFRDLETMQLEMGYDDEWLREQKRAFIETLDHNSDTYKDYNLKLLQEEDKANDELKKQAQKDADEAAKEAKEAADKVKKSYEEVKKSRDSLANDLKTDIGTVFNSSEDTDKRTGEKSKSRKTDTAEFEKKLAAKKKLTSKIAELLNKDVPMSLVKELLKLDPEDALYFANDLLKNPTKLQKLKKDLTEDEDVSNIIANMVTENSDEFTELGTNAGELFGEAFSKAFSENWEAAFDKIFGSEDSLNSTVSVVNSANNTAAQTAVSTPVQTETSSTQTATTTAPAAVKSNEKYIIVDVNGTYIATVVNKENKSKQITGGG